VNIAILTAAAPFAPDPGRALAQLLVGLLQQRGADAEVIRIPAASPPAERRIDDMLICRSLGLGNVDRVIALRFPAYLVAHPCKVCWLLEPWHAEAAADASRQADPPREREIARLIAASDGECLRAARRLFSGSSAVRARLKARNGLDCEVLVPPPADSGAGWNAALDKLLS
jgi:hypothetical protein